MRSRFIFLFTLLVVSLVFLTGCGAKPETPPEVVDEPLPSPYPSSNDLYLPVTGSDPAYPAPESVVRVDPYPGLKDDSMVIDPEKLLEFSNLSPIAGDQKLSSGPVFIEWSELIFKESDPVQVELFIAGNLPNPCHQLRVMVSEPNTDGQIEVNAYSVFDPEKMCIQVLEPFQASIPLGSLPNGEYTVLINGEKAAVFTLP